MQLSEFYTVYLQFYPTAKSIRKHVIAPPTPPPPLPQKKWMPIVWFGQKHHPQSQRLVNQHFTWNHYSKNCCHNFLLIRTFFELHLFLEQIMVRKFVSVTFKSLDKILRYVQLPFKWNLLCRTFAQFYLSGFYENFRIFSDFFLFWPLLWLSDFLEVSLTSQWFLHPIRKLEFWC